MSTHFSILSFFPSPAPQLLVMILRERLSSKSAYAPLANPAAMIRPSGWEYARAVTSEDVVHEYCMIRSWQSQTRIVLSLPPVVKRNFCGCAAHALSRTFALLLVVRAHDSGVVEEEEKGEEMEAAESKDDAPAFPSP